MKFDRTKNALRNIIFGLLQRIYQLIVPFAMRTAMILSLIHISEPTILTNI